MTLYVEVNGQDLWQMLKQWGHCVLRMIWALVRIGVMVIVGLGLWQYTSGWSFVVGFLLYGAGLQLLFGPVWTADDEEWRWFVDRNKE